MVLIFQTTTAAQKRDIHSYLAIAIDRLSSKTPNEILLESKSGMQVPPEQNKSDREIAQKFCNTIKLFSNNALLEKFLATLRTLRAGPDDAYQQMAIQALKEFRDSSKLTKSGAGNLLDFLAMMNEEYGKQKTGAKDGFIGEIGAHDMLARAGGALMRRISYNDLEDSRLMAFPAMASEAIKRLESEKLEGCFAIYLGESFTMEYLDAQKFRNFLEVYKTGEYTLEMARIGVGLDLLSSPEKMASFYSAIVKMEARLKNEAGIFSEPVRLLNSFLKTMPAGIGYMKRLEALTPVVEKFIHDNPIAAFRQEQKEMLELGRTQPLSAPPASQIPASKISKVEMAWQGEAIMFDSSSSKELLYTFNAVSCSAVAIIARNAAGGAEKACLAHIDPGMKNSEVERLFDDMKKFGKLETYILGGEFPASQKVYRYAKKAGSEIHIQLEKFNGEATPDAVAVDKHGEVYVGNIRKYDDLEKARKIDHITRGEGSKAPDRELHIRQLK